MAVAWEPRLHEDAIEELAVENKKKKKVLLVSLIRNNIVILSLYLRSSSIAGNKSLTLLSRDLETISYSGKFFARRPRFIEAYEKKNPVDEKKKEMKKRRPHDQITRICG